MDWKNEVLDLICCEGDIDPREVSRATLVNMPTNFYRYRPHRRHNIDALREGYERLSYPDEYNDPFDARLFYENEKLISYVYNSVALEHIGDEGVRLLKKLTGKRELDLHGGSFDRQIELAAKKKYGKINSMAKSALDILKNAYESLPNDLEAVLDDAIRKRTLLCSFSTTPNNELMWAHYSDCHKGFCIEFGSPEFSAAEGLMLPVVYRDTPLDVTTFMQESYPDGKGGAKAVMGSAMVKSQSWSYEDEWRYCLHCEDEQRELRIFQAKRVLVGCNANDELKEELKAICQEKEIPLIQMKRSKSSFDIIEGLRLV